MKPLDEEYGLFSLDNEVKCSTKKTPESQKSKLLK